MDILATVKRAQDEHGMRSLDYQRYRRFCTGRVQKLRSQLDFHHRQSKSGKRYQHRSLLSVVEQSQQKELKMEVDEGAAVNSPVTGGALLSINYLEMALFEAERAWAFGMEYKKAVESETRHRHDAVKRLRRASQYSAQLAELCRFAYENNGNAAVTLLAMDERTVLDAEAYASWMKATHLFEAQQQWSVALQQFNRAKVICEKLVQGASGGNVSAEQEALYNARLDEIEPAIRYCLYNIQLSEVGLGNNIEEISRQAAQAAGNDRQLNEWFEKFKSSDGAVDAGAQAASAQSLEWNGRRFAAIRNRQLAALLGKIAAIETEQKKSGSNNNYSQQLNTFDKLSLLYADGARLARLDRESNQTAGAKVESARTGSLAAELTAVEACVTLRRWQLQLQRCWLLLSRLHHALGCRYGIRHIPPLPNRFSVDLKKSSVVGAVIKSKPRPMEAARWLDELNAQLKEFQALPACRDDLQLEAEVAAIGGILQALRLALVALKYYGRQQQSTKSWESEQLLREAIEALQDSESNYEMIKQSTDSWRFMRQAAELLDIPAVYRSLRQHCQNQTLYLDILPTIQPLITEAVPLDQQLSNGFAVKLPSPTTAAVPSMQPVSNKPVFFDVAYNLLADEFPAEALRQRILSLGGNVNNRRLREPAVVANNAPPPQNAGAEAQQQQGITGLLGSWWSGRK